MYIVGGGIEARTSYYSQKFSKKVIITGAIYMFDYSIQSDNLSHPWLFRQANRISLFLSDLVIFISKDQLSVIMSHIKVKNLIAFHINSPEIYSVIRWYTNLSPKEPSMLGKSVFEFSHKEFSFGSRFERFRSMVEEMF